MMLITGGSGFLGQALVNCFGDEAISVSRRVDLSSSAHHVAFDLAKPDEIGKLTEELSGYHLTHIIHAAGVTPWADDPDFTQDIQMAESVVTLSRALKIPHVFFLSGWIVYDPAAQAPFTEASSLKPITPYGKSKLAVERYLNENLEGSILTTLRLSSIYGLGQTSPGLIPNFAKAALSGNSLTVGSLQTKRDYLYVDDLTAAIQELVKVEPPTCSVFNIGSGRSVSVAEVAETIKEICRNTYNIDIGTTEADEVREAIPLDNQLDISKLQALGILAHPTSLKVGLEKYLAWLREKA